MEKTYADLVALNQDNFDAFVKSGTTVAKGFEQLTKHFADVTAKSFEEAIEVSKKFATVKNPTEFFQIQSKIFEESVENAIAQSKKVVELSTAIYKDASAPIAERVKANVAAVNTVATTAATTAANTVQKTIKKAA